MRWTLEQSADVNHALGPRLGAKRAVRLAERDVHQVRLELLELYGRRYMKLISLRVNVKLSFFFHSADMKGASVNHLCAHSRRGDVCFVDD